VATVTPKGNAYTPAQVVQQVDQLMSFLLSSDSTDGPAHSVLAALVLGAVSLAEISEISSLAGQPTVECPRMPRPDINNIGNVLLVDR
jgi:hypothetical protein